MGRLVTKRMTLVKKNVAERDFVISWRIRRNWTRNVLKRQKQVSKLGHPHKISNTLLFISIWIVSHFLPPFKLSYFENTIQSTRLLPKLIIFHLIFYTFEIPILYLSIIISINKIYLYIKQHFDSEEISPCKYSNKYSNTNF